VVDRYTDEETFVSVFEELDFSTIPFLRADGSNEQLSFPKAMYLLTELI